MTAIFLAAALLFPAQSIGDSKSASAGLVAEWSYDAELIPDNLVLKLHNRGPRPVCIPHVEAEGSSLRLVQGGTEVDRLWNENRATLLWHGADLADGLTAIPPGRSVTLFYNLRDWALMPGPTDARLALPHVDCLAYFEGAKPSIVRKWLTYQFTVHLEQTNRQ